MSDFSISSRCQRCGVVFSMSDGLQCDCADNEWERRMDEVDMRRERERGAAEDCEEDDNDID